MGHYTKEKWIETSPSSTLNLPEIAEASGHGTTTFTSVKTTATDLLGDTRYPCHGPEDLSKTI
jgi:hypothetical protein